MRAGTSTGPVQLVLPGSSHHIRLARLMASGVASTNGLPMEHVEDARIAVDEICSSLIETGNGHPVRLEFIMQDDALLIRGSTDHAEDRAPNERRLTISHRILDVLADTHRFVRTDGQAVFTVSIPLGDDPGTPGDDPGAG